ncbi:uncharacterized protein LOC133334567 [Musca vetustissima]|uniref:uncharacterized protein LOC133334567 n=1 Tax=Musca vetustissima TaxID=27455 RepID=UPI002AB70834|nr:uncharacterized protein LOC133334567 [Musca vetustissima]
MQKKFALLICTSLFGWALSYSDYTYHLLGDIGNPLNELMEYGRVALALQVNIPKTLHDRQYYFFIVFTWFMLYQRHFNEDMMKIFEICRKMNVKNVVIMTRPVQENFISFHTYSLYTGDYCNTEMTMKEINRYENGRFRYDYLFPDNMKNFHGCKLTVCGRIIAPMLIFNGDKRNETQLKEMHRLGGIEGEILKLVASTMNIKLEYRFPQTFHNPGNVHNFTGCLADLYEQRADMAIGGLGALMPNGQQFSISYTHHPSPYVFVVRGGRPLGPITQLLNPLQINTWQVLLAQLLILIALINWVERCGKRRVRNFILGAHNKYAIHHLFVTLLGSPLPSYTVPRRNFARFLFAAWLLWTMQLRNFYQGKMFDTLRLAKRQSTPKTIHELIDKDYTLLSSIYRDFYPPNKTIIISDTVGRLDVVNAVDMPFTTTEVLDFMSYYNMINWKTSTLTYVDEVIYLYHCVVYFPKHSILLPSFNRKFKLLSDAGITSLVARQWVHPYFRNPKGHINSGEIRQITHKHLIGLYYVYVAMNGIAVVIFIAELGSKRFSVLKRIIERWN